VTESTLHSFGSGLSRKKNHPNKKLNEKAPGKQVLKLNSPV
jgi:hypothetical protein